MIRQMAKELLFIGLGFLSITGVNAQAVSITLQSAPTTISNTGTSSAYYVVGLSSQFPSSSLTLSYLHGMPTGVTQQLTGTAPCTGGVTTLCATNGANQFTLTPGSSCCLAYTLTGSQMAVGANTLQPTVGTSGSPPPYSYNGPSTNVQVNANTTSYTGIYVLTNNYRTTYSTNNGANWASMLSQQSGFWNQSTSAFAVTANGTMYMATGIVGTAGTLIYTSDGTSWAQVNTALPVTGDWVQSVFAAGNTVYVGTGQGYVYSTTGNGSVWTQLAQPSQLDSSQVNAVFVDGSGNDYAGTNNGNVYISDNGGTSWTATQQPDVSAVQSLAVSANGNLYAVTANTRNNNSPPYYSTNQGATAWTAMGASARNTAYAISVSENTVYIRPLA